MTKKILCLFFAIVSATVADEKPMALEQLQSSWEKAKAREFEKLSKTYLKQLERLKKGYLKAENLKAAVACDKAIAEVSGQQNTTNENLVATNEKLVGSWILREDDYTAEFRFNKDGSVDKPGEKNRADWLTYKDYFVLLYPDGGAKVFSFKNKDAPTSLIRIGKKGGALTKVK